MTKVAAYPSFAAGASMMLLCGAVHAQQPSSTPPPSPPVAAVFDHSATLEPIPITSFAVVAAPGDVIAAGDLIRTIRYYGAWRLTCDNRLSTNKRVCAVEQDLAGPGVGMTWRIGLTVDRRPAVSIDASRSIDANQGITMRIGRTTTTIQFEPCAGICRAVVPFAGLIEQGIAQKDPIGFVYSVGGQWVPMAANLDGLSAALNASASPPALVIRDAKTTPNVPSVGQAVAQPAKVRSTPRKT